MFNLVLFGPPGSGKGTQSANLLHTYGLKHISTGDLLREEIAGLTPMGVEAQKYIDQGLLVPDEVVISMISSKIDEIADARGFIFDGFPRTTAQAEALDNLLEFKNTQIHMVISLDVPVEELARRIVERGATSGRTDDTAEGVIKRMEEYNNKTAPVAAYYDQQGKLTVINGTLPIDDVTQTLTRQIDKHLLPVA